MAPQTLHCSTRKRNVSALPEEVVRVRLLEHLVNTLGFPASGIAIERELAGMPHLQGEAKISIPLRRADLVCFAKKDGEDALFPLLLIECKAVKLTRKMEDQVIGYNHFLKASFVALVNQHEARTGWFDPEKGRYCFIEGLPSYKQIVCWGSNRL